MPLVCDVCALQFNNHQDLISHASPCRPGGVASATTAAVASVEAVQAEAVAEEEERA